MALDECEVERSLASLRKTYSSRHRGYEELLVSHASVVASHIDDGVQPSAARTRLLGSAFTAEYAVEGAALCNPSAVLHPDQSALGDGQARVAISVRGIGEGHLSSIGFRSAVIGPGERWEFTPPAYPVTGGIVTPQPWRRAHLSAVLADQGDVDELARTVLRALPSRFDEQELDRVLAHVDPRLLTRPGAGATLQLIRRLVAASYSVAFDDWTSLEQRVLMPAAAEESNGMEDARVTRFVADDSSVEYRATYTAYDGRSIAPRLLTSPDLRVFHAHRLAGAAARNKGMALFPRLVNGRHLALCRADGENSSVTSSEDGLRWTAPRLIHRPTAPWEVLQVGNCGPPIETPAGWLVLTHGVGPMRVYSIGALLLDLDDPSVVLGRLGQPLLEPEPDERNGYVPNVVYSCGAIMHGGTLWIPYGIGDSRIGVAYIALEEILAGFGLT
jgi:predicted GH43/DUF377 family glycosyl hydrolase